MIMDFFKSMQVERPEFNLLPVGEHIVRLIRFEETTSFSQFNGEAKKKDFGWADPTPQLAITVVAAEEGKSGGMTHRLNGQGYLKYNELSDEQKASGEYEEIGGYACTANEDGVIVRILSPEHTKQCRNILNQFAASLGAKEGENLGDVLTSAIANQTKFKVTVVNDEYEGREQLRLSRFKAVANVISEL